jgi:hypothetical protein
MSTRPQLPDSVAAVDTWELYGDLNCALSVEVELPRFRVRDLLVLEARSVVDSGWSHGIEVPVRFNGTVAMTANFEVIGNHLALRLVEVI